MIIMITRMLQQLRSSSLSMAKSLYGATIDASERKAFILLRFFLNHLFDVFDNEINTARAESNGDHNKEVSQCR
jgi:hypothetical protein